MSCNSLSIGRALPCTSSVGGIKAIYAAPFGSLGALTIVGGEVTAIGNDGIVDLYKYDLESSNGLEQAVTASAENGTVFYEQTLTMTLKKLDLASQNELTDLIKSRTSIFIEDYNNNFFLMGATNGVQSSGGSITTGQAYGDLSGFSGLTFSAQEILPAYFVVSTVVTGNASASQIQPA
tara:strand:- start:1797 stop:2333 length:537 start_codon:yes stop_codon:yes gene_type:complete